MIKTKTIIQQQTTWKKMSLKITNLSYKPSQNYSVNDTKLICTAQTK